MTLVHFPKAPSERRVGVVYRPPASVPMPPDPWDDRSPEGDLADLRQQVRDLKRENARLEQVIDNIIRVIDGKELR